MFSFRKVLVLRTWNHYVLSIYQLTLTLLFKKERRGGLLSTTIILVCLDSWLIEGEKVRRGLALGITNNIRVEC
jgi:hypothetical protein